ncbi:hypothetical protein BT69DRAFT_303652 [Atractiella rhizophila]|nr:hypothetical protein BT69DRAFT_303652 [Atractiella rhizophila]
MHNSQYRPTSEMYVEVFATALTWVIKYHMLLEASSTLILLQFIDYYSSESNAACLMDLRGTPFSHSNNGGKKRTSRLLHYFASSSSRSFISPHFRIVTLFTGHAVLPSFPPSPFPLRLASPLSPDFSYICLQQSLAPSNSLIRLLAWEKTN